MQKKPLLKGGVWISAGSVLSAFSSFLRNLLIARLVSVEDFGIATLIAMVLSAMEAISYIAIDRYVIQNPEGNEPRLMAVAHAFQVVRGFVGGGVIYLSGSSLADFFNVSHASWAFELLGLVPVLKGFSHLDATRYQRTLRFSPSVLMETVPSVVTLVVAAPLAIWIGDYSVVVWLSLLQMLLSTLASHYVAERPYRLAWDQKTISRMMSFGWPLMVNGFLVFCIFQGDKALVGRAFSMEELGLYGVAFSLSLAPSVVTMKLAGSLFLPVLSEVQDKRDEFSSKFPVVIEFLLFGGLLIASGFAVFGDVLLTTLYGSRYSAGVEVITWLGLTQAVRTVKSGPMTVAISLGDTKIPMLSNSARALSLLIAILFVSLGYGVVAVAITGLVGEILALSIAMRLLDARQQLDISQFAPTFAVALLICLFVVGYGKTAKSLIDDELIRFLVSLIVFLGALAISWVGMPKVGVGTRALLKDYFFNARSRIK